MKAWLRAVNTPGEEPAAWPMDPGRRVREGIAGQGRSNPAIVPETTAWDVIVRSAGPARRGRGGSQGAPRGRKHLAGDQPEAAARRSAVAALATAEAAESGWQVAGGAIPRQLRLQLLAERGIPGQCLQPGREIAGGTWLGQPGGRPALRASKTSGQSRPAQARPTQTRAGP